MKIFWLGYQRICNNHREPRFFNAVEKILEAPCILALIIICNRYFAQKLFGCERRKVLDF
jgi:hypothetical protein